MTFKPTPSIEDQGGLQNHMKARGLDYDLFKKMLNAKASRAAIGRAIGRSVPVVIRYIDVYRKEQQIPNQHN